MAPMDYNPMVNSPNEKGMILWKILWKFFEVVLIMVKHKKYRIKETFQSKLFLYIQEVSKSNVASSF